MQCEVTGSTCTSAVEFCLALCTLLWLLLQLITASVSTVLETVFFEG
jgi:hypothetical protein